MEGGRDTSPLRIKKAGKLMQAFPLSCVIISEIIS